MIYTGDDTIVAGVSEVRANLPELMVKVQGGKVIITSRGKPVAVLQSYEVYKAVDDYFEKLSDERLLKIALERDTPKAKYISSDQVKKQLLARLSKK